MITTDNDDDWVWIDEWLGVLMSRSMVDRLMELVDELQRQVMMMMMMMMMVWTDEWLGETVHRCKKS